MFFSNALLISVSLTGIMLPTALGVPSPANDIVDIDARGGTLTGTQAAMVSGTVGAVSAAQNVYNTALSIAKGNKNAAIVKNTVSVIKCAFPLGGVVPSGGFLSGGGGLLGSALWGSPASFTGLLDPVTGILGGLVGSCLLDPSNLLSGGGLSGLLGSGGLLGGLLGGSSTLSSLNGLINAVLALLNGGGCSQGDADALINGLVALLDQLIGVLNLGTSCPTGCISGAAGTTFLSLIDAPKGALGGLGIIPGIL
ncbi:hypothetical protein C8F04DRAFT_1387892 [Mycena alexandri]|uniref:Uncharacterized protein n=1 Tax=Mycena alexandri TaxID=1745969 RepID=A0AAD6XIJ0_9AGAR|nr:hypothetical protein C8F04DRAFT_1387892 [Mycena alexandri]